MLNTKKSKKKLVNTLKKMKQIHCKQSYYLSFKDSKRDELKSNAVCERKRSKGKIMLCIKFTARPPIKKVKEQ